MEPDEESNYTPEEKATYQKIKEYVKDKYGVHVHTYIAQVNGCVVWIWARIIISLRRRIQK